MQLTPGQVVERYTVEAELGEGGVATVYRVRHNTLGSLHALKILHVSGTAIRERLVQEGRVQAQLRHPNIVAVTDVVDLGGTPGLLMEYVEGQSLDRWLQLHRPDVRQAEEIFRGILAGVARAHRLGLIHRDLKPGNVLMEVTEDGTLVPKVSDFGLAKILSDDEGSGASKTRSGMTMGTPAYMAPEQVRDAKTVDQRADVFALGCILYELCTGVSPFDQGDVLAIFSALAAGTYTPPEQLAPDIPVRIRNTIVGCLSNRRESRIPDCAILRQVLDGSITEPWPTLAPTTVEELRAAGRSSSGAGPVAPAALSLPPPPATSRGAISSPTFALEETGRTVVPEGGAAEGPPARAVPPPPSLPPAQPSSPPEEPARASGAGAGLALVGAGGLAVLLALVGVGAVGIWLWSRDVPESDPAPVPVASSPTPETVVMASGTPAPAPAPAAPEVAPAPVAAAPASPAPASPAPAATPAPARPSPPTATPTAAAATPPAAMGTVTATGDADEVWLEGESGRVELGRVPAGTYKVKARFRGEAAISAGVLTVRDGRTVSLSCSADFQLCKSK